MRLRVDRSAAERALRIAALVSLAFWIANAARPRSSVGEVARTDGLTRQLPLWTRNDATDRVRLRLDTVPDARTSAWLAALRSAGVSVSWSAPTVKALAIETYRSADPGGAAFALTAADADAGARVLADAFGPIDTLPASPTAMGVRVAAVEGEVTLAVGDHRARAAVAPGPSPRRVLVTGAAGWEAKFVVAALEESGWRVDAALSVGPGQVVTQGGAGNPLDTARYAAAVFLDSAAAGRARRVADFVRSGGGVVLAGDASRARSVSGMVGWRTLRRETAPLGTLPGDTVWRGLSRLPFDTTNERGSIVLEARNGRAVVLGRRHYGGRVVAVGYDETWRWRMAGGDDSHLEHREWWSRAVASVAQSPSPGTSMGAAPLASLHHILGPPSPAPQTSRASLSPAFLSNVLGAIVLAALLTEWFLRRSRGAR